jgi:hypothetical protein
VAGTFRRRRLMCSRCQRRPATEGGLCYLDILFLARLARTAYDGTIETAKDEARLRRSPGGEDEDDKRKRENRIADRIARAHEYLAWNHEVHLAPLLGCPFCILRVPRPR